MSKGVLARGRAARRAIVALLSLFVLAGLTGYLGPKTATVTVRKGGYTVSVRYPAVTRPGLPIRWEYTVTHAGGFDGPVSLAITFDYLHLFDLTNIEPQAAEATSTSSVVVYSFRPPAGDTLRVSMDATAETGFHEVPATTTDVAVNGRAVVSIEFDTRVVP